MDLGSVRKVGATHLDRRRFVQGMALTSGALAVGFAPRAGWAQARSPAVLSGDRFDLTVDTMPINITGNARTAVAVNGSVPAPTLRWREGDVVTLNVTNRLDEPTSIHWHGIRLPAAMDGVPGLTFAGIMPGETFVYRFPVKQSGTYWYHSHSGAQEPLGLYGALIVEPRDPEPYAYDRDHVIVLSDWSDEHPMTIISNLKQEASYYNYGQRTLGDFLRDAKRDGLGPTLKERLMWGRMRMSPTDILDVTGATFTYLVNGQSPRGNWTGLFKPGERVRLRFINAAVMTIFDTRIPGLQMTLVQADGSDVAPLTIDEFRIGPGETYDVIVEPPEDAAYAIFAQAMDRSGYARGTLAPRQGMVAVVPPMDPRPLRTMKDMGMAHDMAGMDMAGADSSSTDMSGMGHGSIDMSGMDHGSMSAMAMGHDMGGMVTAAVFPPSKTPARNADGVDPATLRGKPGVDNVAAEPQDRLAEAGDGLDGNGRRVLTYAALKALTPWPDQRPPDVELEFHVTGNMERWVWGFNGKTFSEAGPIRVKLGDRVRFVLINDTMMEHPIHLHGFFSEIENGQGDHRPVKHTITIKPGERMSFLFSADAPGHWAFHCHLLYHMDMGMFRTVVVA
jgi:CopA family copper-resistance protein